MACEESFLAPGTANPSRPIAAGQALQVCSSGTGVAQAPMCLTIVAGLWYTNAWFAARCWLDGSMSDSRRCLAPGGAYFFTLVTQWRARLLQ